MLRTLLFPLSFSPLCVTDCDIIADLTHRVLIMGLLNVGILGCIGVRITIARWLAHRSQR